LGNEYVETSCYKETGNVISAASMFDLSGSETKIGIIMTHGNDLFQVTVNKIRNKFVNISLRN